MLSNRLIQLRALKFPLATLIKRDMSVPCKIAKPTKYIGTHDNTFHCDDVTACTMLKQLDRFKDHEIVRTRDESLLAAAEIIVDVGSVLDVERLRLDHHQRTFNQTIKDYHPKLRTTNPEKPPRLSSSGLVYAVFGKDIITKILEIGSSYNELNGDDKNKVDKVYEKAYVEFFEEIDAIDNGVELVSGDDIVYNYHINSGISSRVGRLNPLERDASPELRLKQFKRAMKMVEEELLEGIKFLGDVWWPAKQKFRKSFLERNQVDPSGQIVLLDEVGVGWKSALLEMEEEFKLEGQVKFIIFSESSQESPWRILALPVSLKSFISRVPLKEEWRGKRGEDLQKLSGISDASFVHMTGFTGGAKSKAGVLELARKTLNL